jgi:hypothetical protein
MPRELTRVKPELDEDTTSSGLDEFKHRERVTKEVSDSGRIAPGWSSDTRPKVSLTKIPRFKVPDDGEEILVKFLDDRPFAPIFQHWLLVEGQRRAYTCILEIDPDTRKVVVSCPLCDRGDKAKSSDWFNVVVLGDTPELQVWYATGDPSSAIKEKAEGKRTSPINKEGLYFAISKRKASNGFNTYSVETVKEDELKADWGVRSLTPDELSKFNDEKYDGSIVKVMTSVELSEIARKFLSDD